MVSMGDTKTTKIAKFDRATCSLVNARIAEALMGISAELGVSIRPVGGTFATNHYVVKLEIATISDDGAVQSRDADAFRHHAGIYGLSPNDLGRSFRSGGRDFVITGLRSRGKRQILASNSGKEFCFVAEDVRRLLSTAKAP